MAVTHAASGQVIDIRPLAEKLTESVTTTLIKTDKLEVIRLVLPAGKEIPQHHVAGELTVQCLEGRVDFNVQGQTKTLAAGQLLFLSGTEPHALRSLDDSSVLVTILLGKKSR